MDSDQCKVRLTSEGESPSSSSSSSSESGDQWDCIDGGVDAEVLLQTGGHQQILPVRSRKRVTSSSCDPLCEGVDSENEVFFKKCLELQCYIQPLSSILQGLMSGRFSQRLGSYQESLATDRIKRILWLLQKPDLSGPLPRIILIIAEMLQSWFPHIKPDLQQTQIQTAAKRKRQQSEVSCAPPSPWTPLCFSSPHICSVKTADLAVSPPPASTPPAHHRQEVTQDNAVSSSTDSPSRSQQSLLSQPRRSPCLRRLLQTEDGAADVTTEVDDSDVS